MPSTSRRQQRFMYAQLEKRAKGEQGDTNMTEAQLMDFAKTRIAGKSKKGRK